MGHGGDDEFERKLRDAIVAELLEPLDPTFLTTSKNIYCYRTLAGDMPSKSFLYNDIGASAAANYRTSFRAHCGGSFINREKYHALKGVDGVSEYKHNGSKSRLLHITDKWNFNILLFGFTGKKENDIAQVHILRAEKLRDEYRARRAEIEKKVRGRSLQVVGGGGRKR